MPFKASNSSYYKVEIQLPGYGKTPRLSTKTTRKKTAEQMEQALRYVWQDGYHELIEALEPQGRGQGGKIDLPTLYHAWRKNNLQDLLHRIEDPPLEPKVREFGKRLDYGNHRLGARHLLRLTTVEEGPQLAGNEPTVSWLYDPDHIDRLVQYMIHEDGYKPNTVRNNLWGFLSKFLPHTLGEAKGRSILSKATRPTTDDRRDVVLTAEDLHRVISASEWEVRMFLLLKASTGIDKTPLLRIRRRDVDWEKWSLFVRDNKTESRRAAIDLPPVGIVALRKLFDEREEGGQVEAFSLSRGQLDYRWRKARSHAKLTPEHGYEDGVRLKDLRHTFAANYVQAGGDMAGLMGRLRHQREAQTLMYARYETTGISDMEAAASSMGLELPEEMRDELQEPNQEDTSRQEIPEWWFDRSEPPRLLKGESTQTLDIPQRGRPGSGGRKGYDPVDYRRAVKKEETISGAAAKLGVHESTVREQCKRHEIVVPSINRVPGQDGSN